MQHLGSEDEMEQALHDLLTSLTLEQRLAGLSLEERLAGMSRQELEQMLELIEERTKADGSSTPE